ncbi:hypothetical protein J2S49_001098 [Arcanobacterium wilhelmae]|uniref:Uncharacterized protein n=1 Tax=Arcanobacterium wilhelmae TaxID=1803177 RepID=A0ABT9NBD4_9ACTO|nr:hypothetical protein [Arcanobacterium wilhelmae]MDP9801022.1 hypothetical protein [Arcanobacterium wilhelmae]WFN90381.1 hypothetical protein P8A24_00530 [Arcanobacterium wilhelmae]
MAKRIIQGKEISDEQVEAWVDEAEAGYDVTQLGLWTGVSEPDDPVPEPVESW